MRVTRETMELAQLARDSETLWDGVRLEPDGSAVVTDGHLLVKWTPNELNTKEGDTEAFTVATASAKALCKALRKGNSRRQADTAEVDASNVNGSAEFSILDENGWNKGMVMAGTVDGKFPSYGPILDGARESSEPSIGFNPDLMLSLCRVFKAQGCKAVKLETDGPDRALRLSGETETGKFRACLMPMMLK
jgi:hypothetical protein